MNTLDKNSMHSLKIWLLARETELLAEIDSGQKAGEAAAAADTSEVNDQEEQASKRERTTIQDAEVQRDNNELVDVRAALARMNDGNYGACIDCGQPINPQRLGATPSAARCMACQIKFEARTSWV
jgi:RNA polymerase-binding transcription factor DksA